ncbi:Elongation factor Ts [Hibiscus syriacus]|uniref:Elongation factor Ts, mitochondrial n=1 Tax=Hibiscus syriacus TaxID=106335 RepID=A0A6A3CRZ4_HIBSY|nr:Elongation factor Ts [Hibiscus syriacus]
MTHEIPCSVSNITFIPGAAWTVRKNTSLTRCSSSRKNTCYALLSRRFVLPLSTSVYSFRNYRTGHALDGKLGIRLSATGIDVAVEESDSSVTNIFYGGSETQLDEVETSEHSTSPSSYTTTPTQSKRARPVRKSEMPPVKNEKIIPGTMFTGKVRSIQPFGAFVDIGAFTEGLMHVSKLSDSFVKDVASVVSVGQEVNVRERPPRKNSSRSNQKRDVESLKFVKGQELDSTVKNLTREKSDKIEVNCEMDFVSQGDICKELVDDLAMQVASSPQVEYLVPEDAPEGIVNREKEIGMQKEDLLSKPEQIRSKNIEGRIRKRLEELALLEQPYIKNDMVKDWVLEKKSQDFAEVAAQIRSKPVSTAGKEQSTPVKVEETNEKVVPPMSSQLLLTQYHFFHGFVGS